jgi:hypothetical protein
MNENFKEEPCLECENSTNQWFVFRSSITVRKSPSPFRVCDATSRTDYICNLSRWISVTLPLVLCGFVPNRLKETHAKDRRRQKFTQSQFEFAATSIQPSLDAHGSQRIDRTCVRRNLLKIIIPSGGESLNFCMLRRRRAKVHARTKCHWLREHIYLRRQAPPTADRKLIMYPNKMLLCDLADRKITRQCALWFPIHPSSGERADHFGAATAFRVFLYGNGLFPSAANPQEQMLNQLDGSSSAGLISLGSIHPIW